MDGLLVWTVPASVARSNQAAKTFSLIFDFSLIVSNELVKGGEELEETKRRCCRCLCLLYAGTLEPRFRAAFLTCFHLLLLLGETTRFYKPHWVSHKFHAASKHICKNLSRVGKISYDSQFDKKNNSAQSSDNRIILSSVF